MSGEGVLTANQNPAIETLDQSEATSGHGGHKDHPHLAAALTKWLAFTNSDQIIKLLVTRQGPRNDVMINAADGEM